MKKEKKKKTLTIISWILKIFVGIIIVGFILMVSMQRFSNNEFSLFNIRIFSVLTGSMKPQYDIGDVLVSMEKDPEDIKVGDAISYLGDEGSFDGKVVTHEVIKIETDEDGKLLFRTKGIANAIEDPIVSEDQIYGVVIYKTVILSFIYDVISTPLGMYTLIIVPVLIIVGYEIISRMLEKEAKRRGSYRE